MGQHRDESGACTPRDYQFRIGHLLQILLSNGISSTKVGVDTAENTKVPDVIWASRERRRAVAPDLSWSRVPEICVEVISPSNLPEEQLHKSRLYLEAGAEEFWLCDDLGNMQFFDTTGSLPQSHLCPEFPAKVELPD